MKFRDLLLATGLSLSLLTKSICAQEVTNREKPLEKAVETESEIIKPTLEEIASLIKKDPNEILKDAINKGDIKKFEYTRQTNNNDFYKFLNNEFKEKVIFTYFTLDKDTKNKTVWLEKATNFHEINFGPAVIFLYTSMNIKNKNHNVGFLFIELRDFYGQQNWDRLKDSFKKELYFPCFLEFVRKDDGGYELNDIVKAGTKNPKIILRWIDSLVEDYRKRTSK